LRLSRSFTSSISSKRAAISRSRLAASSVVKLGFDSRRTMWALRDWQRSNVRRAILRRLSQRARRREISLGPLPHPPPVLDRLDVKAPRPATEKASRAFGCQASFVDYVAYSTMKFVRVVWTQEVIVLPDL
jgi:hypothetical protein